MPSHYEFESHLGLFFKNKFGGMKIPPYFCNLNNNQMENKLQHSDIVKKLNFSMSSAELSFFQIGDLVDCVFIQLDFDVYLPSKGINLQRELVWTDLQKSEFILSIFKGNQIPKFTLIKLCSDLKDRLERYQIIDGKQRLTTILQFIAGEFPIEVNNTKYYYEDLSEYLQKLLYRFWVTGTVGYSYNDNPITDQEKIDWFEQINFTGTPQDKEHLNKLKHANRIS